MKPPKYSAAECLRKLLSKLTEYTLDEDITSLMEESRQVLEYAHERASNAAKASSGASGRNRQSPETIKKILRAKGSNRQIAEKIGGISHEGVRKIRAKHGNLNKDS